MSNYQVTARKWRPLDFNQVMGQEHVTQTLINAIKFSRIGQSYLFSGPRGVGKTTLARILAKALNCERGPTNEPCNQCQHCQDINQYRSMDYVEIDGATNRGIEDIRSLKETLGIASVHGKYRIIVIDEVHMLTKEAFNALLKSLEEPPEKLVFIFCTTEATKVPATIRSRCQHYHFKAFSIKMISQQLAKILSAENIQFEEKALFYIARSANGSMRDSQSILDQVVAYSGKELTVPATLAVLGVTSYEVHQNFFKNLTTNDGLGKNVKLIKEMMDEGRDCKSLFLQVLEKINEIILIKTANCSAEDLQISEEDYQNNLALSEFFLAEELFVIAEILMDFINDLKDTIDHRLIIHTYLIKLHRYQKMISVEALKKDLEKILQQETQIEQEKPNDKDLAKGKGDNPTSPQATSSQFNHPLSKKTLELSEEEIFTQIQSLVKEGSKTNGRDYLGLIGFDNDCLTLQLKKEIPEKSIDNLKNRLNNLFLKNYNTEINVNIIAKSVSYSLAKKSHAGLKTFKAQIVKQRGKE